MSYSKLSDANAAIRGIKPAVTLAQANLSTRYGKVLPFLAMNQVPNTASSNVEPPCKCSLRDLLMPIGMKDTLSFLLSQFGLTVILTEIVCSKGAVEDITSMNYILFGRNPFKIIQAIIERITIFVISLKVWGRGWSYKCLQNKPIGLIELLFAHSTQSNPSITTKPMLFPVFWSMRFRLFSSAYLTKITNLIMTIIAGNIFPKFLHNYLFPFAVHGRVI